MAHAIIHRLLDAMGLEVQRRSTLHQFLHSREIDLILDVGANLGFFGQSVRQKGYRDRIWSFEPVDHVFEALSHRAAPDPRWKVSKLALGSEPGEAIINVLDNHCLSSLRQPTALAEAFNTSGPTSRQPVQVETLDRLLADDPAQHIFLKIDVQGYEKEVLAGARETLGRACAVHIELPIEHLYEGNWRFAEAIENLDALGFLPAQFRPVCFGPDDPASALEFDVLFRRK